MALCGSAAAVRLTALLVGTGLASGFYLPGVAPHEMDGELVDVKVNKLTSTMTALPYDYYRLPSASQRRSREGGEPKEVLHGSKIQNSSYMLYMGKADFKVLCRAEVSKKEAKQFAQRIREDYRVHLIMDNLPAATRMISELPDGKTVTMYDRGYRLGFMGAKEFPGTTPKVPYLNNHLRFIVKYHRDEKFEGARIVGFEVEAFSVKHTYKGTWGKDHQLTSVPPPPTCRCSRCSRRRRSSSSPTTSRGRSAHQGPAVGPLPLHGRRPDPLVLDPQLARDRAAADGHRRHDHDAHPPPRPQPLQLDRGEGGAAGGERLEARPRRRPAPAAAADAPRGVGRHGMQLLCMAFIAIAGAMLGFLSPANRGSLLTAVLLLFVLMGVVAGYTGSYTYKSLKGAHWKTLTITTASLIPGVVFVLFLTINFFIWGRGSSGAAPFGTIFALIVMWFCISMPLVFLGAFFGFKQRLPEPPVRTNEIPRQVPEQEWYMSALFTMAVGGILPFGAVFIELFFIMSSVWLQRFYYVFGFLALVMLILLVTCAEISIVLCYFQLCNEDYNWWWRSFLNSGSAGLYLFGYAFVYFYTQLEITGFVPCLVYFGYMLIASLLFTVITGTVGFLSSWWFVWQIFAAVKVD